MNRILEVIQAPAFLVALYILLALGHRELEGLLTAVGGFITEPLALLLETIRDLRDAIRSSRDPARHLNERARDATQAFLQEVIQGLNSVASSLRRHVQYTISFLEPDQSKRGWRVLGALISLAAIGLFIYADMAQGANTITTLFPEVEVPRFLQDLVVPLLVASAGTAAALGMIIGDCIGLTHFIPLERVAIKRFRTTVLAIATVNFLGSLTIAVLMSLNRYQELSTHLPPDFAARIHDLAALAQSLLLAPLLLTTILLAWGLAGFVVLYAAALSVIAFVFQWASFVTRVLEKVVALGAIGSDIVLRVFLSTLFLVPAAIAAVSALLAAALERLFDSLQKLLGVALAPPRLIRDFIIWIYGQAFRRGK